LKSEYSRLPSPSYAQGFVRNYAEYLGIPAREIIPIFKREFDEKRAYRVLPKGFTRDEEYLFHGIRIRRTALGIFLVILLFGGFLLYQYRAAFLNPPLRIETPEDNATIAQEVKVTGETDPNATVYINTDSVAVASDGSFEKIITLFPGKTIIEITSKNKYGKTAKVERTVTVK
jgi:cytoskeletal protein RodZ